MYCNERVEQSSHLVVAGLARVQVSWQFARSLGASGDTGYHIAGLACYLATAVAFHPNRFALAELRVFWLVRDLLEQPS